MPSFRNPNPMAIRPQQERDRYDQSDYEEQTDKNGTKTTYYKDGSSTVHWGGPCGSSSYDENGEEI